MANYYASARSNYFRVKDEAVFRNWVGRYDALEVIDGDGMVGLLCTGGDGDGWPSMRWLTDDELAAIPESEPCEEFVEIDFLAELSAHLVPGSVAVLMEAGAEKLRYISGWAAAVDSTGETVSLSLSRIMDLAREKFGPAAEITECQY